MRRSIIPVLILILITGCASNVRFIPIDESYVPESKSETDEIVFRKGKIEREHTVIGVIEAELGKNARKPQLDALLIEKAREVGADGLMQVEYDIDRDVYWEKHTRYVGPGPWKKRVVVRSHPEVSVRKTASALAVIFDQ